MLNRLIIRIDENKVQDLPAFRKFLVTYGYKDRIFIEEKDTHIEMTCKDTYVGPVISLVERCGYWVSEMQEVETAGNKNAVEILSMHLAQLPSFPEKGNHIEVKINEGEYTLRVYRSINDILEVTFA